ncbi:DUF2784 domain-containing protein [Desulfovibrio mangrovi]|uniref:DUF2784 domain-containing protein n=1 Tax=Desulfovibrio mangrovi TaxID=2976983 RepID=UPI002247B540|nr:DUF2784 domain-containing protein [Desulfovibrio mangrovi]UZP68667.1 DUF2784 domain-containing protein [Desulfovibrio mangrovi]
MDGRLFAVLADAMLVLHFGIAAYNVLGLPVIWIGRVFRRSFVHNPWFRYSHLACMGAVLLLVLFETICPFTDWEYQLRLLAARYGRPEITLIQESLGGILYSDADWTTFGVMYGLWFLAILVTLWLVPVRPFLGERRRGLSGEE